MELELIRDILQRRDGMSLEDALSCIADVRVYMLEALDTDEEDPEDVLFDMLGLEPDYIMDPDLGLF